MNKGNKIRILIGDRQPIFRSGLVQLLSKKAGITVVGEAGDCEETLKMVNGLKPSILILDSLLLESDTVDLMEELKERHNKLGLILLSHTEREDDSTRAMRGTGASIVPKQASFETLVECIHKVDSGETWMAEGTEAVEAEGSSPASGPRTPAKDQSPLSFREKQVVSLVSQGYRNKEISERMFISEQTVKNHLHNIFDKLGVSDRLELALYAIHKDLQMPE